jgi:hypothetical protein
MRRNVVHGSSEVSRKQVVCRVARRRYLPDHCGRWNLADRHGRQVENQ